MKNLPFSRADRIADTIFEVVSQSISLELADYRLENVEITRVIVSRDLRLAKINFCIPNSDEERRKEAIKGFESAKGYLRCVISSAIDLKFMPELKFYYDTGLESERKIEELLEADKQRKRENI